MALSLLNSVSFVDGKKYRNNRQTYALMRKTSDDLCKEYGLSVIEEKPCGKLKIDYTKYYNAYILGNDYYTTTKEDIDKAIKIAYSYKNFEKILQEMGYTITMRAGKISLCRPPYKRNIRIERSFGEEYSVKNIEERIINTENTKFYSRKLRNTGKRYKGKVKKQIRVDRGRLYKLYLHYCYILKIFPNNKNTRIKMTPKMRTEIKNMKEISEEIRFICRNKIETTINLFLYKNNVVNELKKQMKLRNTLRRKRQKEKEPKIRQKLCDEILVLSDKIKYLKKEVALCEKIENQNQKIKKNMEEIQKEEEIKQRRKEK